MALLDFHIPQRHGGNRQGRDRLAAERIAHAAARVDVHLRRVVQRGIEQRNHRILRALEYNGHHVQSAGNGKGLPVAHKPLDDRAHLSGAARVQPVPIRHNGGSKRAYARAKAVYIQISRRRKGLFRAVDQVRSGQRAFTRVEHGGLIAFVLHIPSVRGDVLPGIPARKRLHVEAFVARLIHTARIRYEISLDEPLRKDWDGNELLLSDILGTESDLVYRRMDDKVEKQLLRAALARLPLREQQIMQLRFGLGGAREMTQKEVADALGISQSYISRLEKRILSRLNVELTRMSS